MGGMQPGDKLTAANVNAAFMCRTDDTSTTGRIKTDRYIVEGKVDVESAENQTLEASKGVILITAPAGLLTGNEGADTLSPDPTQGAENGQTITIINKSGGDYALNFLSEPIDLDDGQGVKLYYCSTAGEWLPVGGTGGGGAATKEVDGAAPGTVGQLVYHDGTNWQLADHSDLDKVAIAMIVEVGPSSFVIQTSGPVELPGHGFTVGDYYFGDKATLGGATDTKPVDTGDIQKSIFHVTDDNCIELLLQNEPVLISSTESEVVEGIYGVIGGGDVVDGLTNLNVTSTTIKGSAVTFSAPNSITINKSGLYTLHLRLTSTNAAQTSGNIMQGYLRINGSADDATMQSAPVGFTGSNRRINVDFSIRKYLSAGDVILVQASEISAGNVPLQAGLQNTFSIFRLGE